MVNQAGRNPLRRMNAGGRYHDFARAHVAASLGQFIHPQEAVIAL
jgi:hypothetical protein